MGGKLKIAVVDTIISVLHGFMQPIVEWKPDTLLSNCLNTCHQPSIALPVNLETYQPGKTHSKWRLFLLKNNSLSLWDSLSLSHSLCFAFSISLHSNETTKNFPLCKLRKNQPSVGKIVRCVLLPALALTLTSASCDAAFLLCSSDVF